MRRLSGGGAAIAATLQPSADRARPALRAGATLGLSGDLSVSFEGLAGSAEDARRFFSEGLGATRLRLPPPEGAGGSQGALLSSMVDKGLRAAELGAAEAELVALLDGLTQLQAELRLEAARPLGVEVQR